MHRLRTWGLEWMARNPYSVIALSARKEAAELTEKEEELLAFATGNIVEEVLESHAPSVTFKNGKKQWIIVTPTDDVRSLIELLGREIRTYQKVEARFGVSERMSAFQGLHVAYRQAFDCLRAALLSEDAAMDELDELDEWAAYLSQGTSQHRR